MFMLNKLFESEFESNPTILKTLQVRMHINEIFNNCMRMNFVQK